MLTDILLSLLTWVLNIASQTFPTFNLPSDIMYNLTILYSKGMTLNYILPLVEIRNWLILILLFETFILIARLVSGVISLVRGGGKIDI